MDNLSPSLNEIIESYKTHLEIRYPLHYKILYKGNQIILRVPVLKQQIFSYLQQNNERVEIGEDINKGGVDLQGQNQL